jgi:hypothetical protein
MVFRSLHDASLRRYAFEPLSLSAVKPFLPYACCLPSVNDITLLSEYVIFL